MSYETAVYVAKTWGLVILIAFFAVAVAYALWPGNRDKFRRAARRPLSDDSANDGPGAGA